MPNEAISQLTDGGSAQATDQIPINRGGTNYRLTVGNIGGQLSMGSGFFNVLSYGAVANNSTDNATAFAALAADVNAFTEVTVNGREVEPPTVYFPAGAYLYTSGLSFTQPVTLRGEQGSVLNYTGSAHAIDMGPAGLNINTYQDGAHTVQDLTFIGGASMTYGIYFHPYTLNDRVLHCSFRNFGHSTSWAVYFSAGTYDNEVAHNFVQGDDNTLRNFCKVAPDINSYLRFTSNVVANNGYGIGLWLDSLSIVEDNSFVGPSPNIYIGSLAPFSKITNNIGEFYQGGNTPMIQFETISNLVISGWYVQCHNSALGILGPANGSAIISSSLIENIYCKSNYSTSSAPLIVLNNLTGQTGNIYFNLSSENPSTPYTTGSNITVWQTPLLVNG
jgi:hypothetical protein